uniref:Uncharacterized protein n=1 Tax=Trichuris muris TaxID=70415 RepID=A0A5S6R4W7_TRIMR
MANSADAKAEPMCAWVVVDVLPKGCHPIWGSFPRGGFSFAFSTNSSKLSTSMLCSSYCKSVCQQSALESGLSAGFFYTAELPAPKASNILVKVKVRTAGDVRSAHLEDVSGSPMAPSWLDSRSGGESKTIDLIAPLPRR